MMKGKKREKLILATLLAGTLAAGQSAFADELDDMDFSGRGEPAYATTYVFGGKPFANVHYYGKTGGYIKNGPVEYVLRPLLKDGEDTTAVYQGLKYWYGALGTPVIVPDMDVYLLPEEDSAGAGNSLSAGDITRLAECFQKNTHKNPAQPFDVMMLLNQPMENQKWYVDRLGILPTNGTDADYPGTVVHEMFHALGVGRNFSAEFTNDVAPIEEANFTSFDKQLYDISGKNIENTDKLVMVASKAEAVDPKSFYLLKHNINHGDVESRYAGVYFKGQHVDEVLTLNDQKALIAWPDDTEIDPVPGIPMNSIEREDGIYFAEMSHFELQNSLQSHQDYRNWSIPMEVELAALEDLGYTIDRRKLFGNSIYNNGIEYVNNNPFYERKNGKYLEGVPSTQSLAIGLHIYGSNNKILQKSNLLADGAESMGSRVDGVGNKLTIAKTSKVTANGVNGRGINFAYGNGHELNVEGTVTALGKGGKALAFDFGDNDMGNSMGYRGSYIRTKVEVNVDGNKFVRDWLNGENYPKEYQLSALNGALVNNVNISGTVAGKDAAIYIAPNALVKNININTGAELQGDIISDWSPTGGYPDILGKNLTVEEQNIHLPEGEYGLTRLNFAGDKLSYAGNIGPRTDAFAYASFIMNVNSGSLNYKGIAKIDSVNVAKGAILQGGTFKLNKEGSHIREGLSKENSGKLINKGMLSAALPKGSDTVLSVEGTVVNEGAMGFIGNVGNQGRIKIDGSLEGNKILAINPNGIYLPGDSYDISDLITVNGEKLSFDDAKEYNNGVLKAVYSDDFTRLDFAVTGAIQETEAVAEMGNLDRALAKQGALVDELQVANLFRMKPAKANKALKSIKARETANIPAVMQQNNLVHNALGMRLSQVNRAKSAKVNVTVKQLTEGEAIVKPMDIIVQPEYDMWAKISRNNGEINADSDYKTDAYSIGWDKQVNKDWRFGFFGSFAKGKFEAETIYNSLEDYRLGVYGGYNKGPAEAMVYADYGWGKNKLNRTLSGLGISTNAKYDSNIMEIGAEYKYDLQQDKAWHVAPYGALQLNRYSQKAYAESGAEPFNKKVGKLNNTYAGVEAGLDLERCFANGSAYGMRLGYKRGLTGVEPKQSYHYAADPEHRYTNYGEGDKNKLVLRLNGQMQTAPNWSISGEAGYERGKKGHGYSGEISIKYTW